MLTDSDKTVLALLADNPVLFDTVQRVIKDRFSPDSLSTDMTNEQLGERTRTRIEGIQKVEDGFREIASCATVNKENVTITNGS